MSDEEEGLCPECDSELDPDVGVCTNELCGNDETEGTRRPTPVFALSELSTNELLTQLRDRISDLVKAPNNFSKGIHAGIAHMLLDEIQRSLSGT